MRVLLTGAGGFIGGAVADALLAAGHDVVGLDAWISQAHPDGVGDRDVRVVDLRGDAPQPLADALAGVDVVCHQAAMVGAGAAVADLVGFADHNVAATARLLVAMHAAGVDRLVLASSMVVYGEGRYTCAEHGPQAPGRRSTAALAAGDFENACPVCGGPLAWSLVEEDARLDPRSSYAASKVAQEHFAAAWTRQSGGVVEALRYHNVYGPGMPRNSPYSGVAALFRSAVAEGRAPDVYEDGGQVRDFVHVADVARANLAAVERAVAVAPETVEAFNVCSGTPVDIGTVASLVSSGAGGRPPHVSGRFRPGDVRHVVASPRRARDVLGFTAEVSPEEGLVAFADAPLR